ncbi:MAG: NosD domain-containing protein [Thermoplasmata archaeon]
MKLESKVTKGVGLRNARCNTRGFTNGFTNGNGYRNGRKLKESRNHGKILAVFVLAMLVLSVVAVLTWQSSSAGVIKINAGTKMEIKYTPRGPIHINGNADFTSANGVIGGSGTQSDPYIIEGWEIDANGGAYAIWIENTDVYFVIRNCKVYGAAYNGGSIEGGGITLYFVKNGILENNHCTNSSFGIILAVTQNTTARNNKVFNNSEVGVDLRGAISTTICENIVSGSNIGVYLSSNAQYNNLTQNNVSYNNEGIRGIHTHFNTITGNNLAYNRYGIYLTVATNNTITYNSILYNTEYGIYMFYACGDNYIHHNNFIGNRVISKGNGGNSQAYDVNSGNSWHDATVQQGNYWSNWDGQGWGTPNAYPIDGGAGASDWYPLGNPVCEGSAQFLLPVLLSGIIGFAGARIRKTAK